MKNKNYRMRSYSSAQCCHHLVFDFGCKPEIHQFLCLLLLFCFVHSFHLLLIFLLLFEHKSDGFVGFPLTRKRLHNILSFCQFSIDKINPFFVLNQNLSLFPSVLFLSFCHPQLEIYLLVVDFLLLDLLLNFVPA